MIFLKNCTVFLQFWRGLYSAVCCITLMIKMTDSFINRSEEDWPSSRTSSEIFEVQQNSSDIISFLFSCSLGYVKRLHSQIEEINGRALF